MWVKVAFIPASQPITPSITLQSKSTYWAEMIMDDEAADARWLMRGLNYVLGLSRE